VGVTGGIAAYKVCEVVSGLVRRGASVHVIMTRAATRFVGPLTFQTLSGNPVYVELLEPPKLWNVEHIALAERADLLVIAPATANIVGKISSGICDDYLSTVAAAFNAPVLLCPAMHSTMYANPIYQANEARLKAAGYHVLPPAHGRLASGAVGQGRLPEAAEILSAIQSLLLPMRDCEGLTVLVTAGPTREFFDPVRYVSNPSSGRMGFALAAAAAGRGASVELVSGPVELPDPPGVRVTRVVTAEEMREAVLRSFTGGGLVMAAAAVSDYRPAERMPHKQKKGPQSLSVSLQRTPDILAELGARKGEAFLVGFAAETQDLLANARAKMAAKNLDLVVVNDVTRPGAGFGSETNQVTLVWPDGRTEERPLESKRQLAEYLLTAIRLRLEGRGSEG
jgi:phosphopantothenoylcysteine decarboxylase/phosphopantothenate--cysteine ligase